MQILYVEDHTDTATVFKLLLEREGHQVTVARTAKEAKEICIHRVFDLWLLDLVLPDGHGGDLLKALRKMSDTRAIALTGKGMPHEVAEGKDDGFDDYLVKPVEFGQLLNAVHQVPSQSDGLIEA